MFKQLMSFLVIAGFVLAMAPAAQALTLSDSWDGDYRIIFVTLGEHGAKDIAIGPYNTFVSDQAGLAASTQTSGLSTTWTAVGSTTGTSARENTATTGAGTDIHIYTPSTTAGDYTLVAESYTDLWDGSILAAIQFGDGSLTNETDVWTGTKFNGVQDDYSGDASGPLGTSEGGSNTGPNRNIALGRASRTNNGWIKAGNNHDGEGDNGRTYMNHFMGMSGVITPGSANAVPEPATATLALLGLGGLMMRRRRQA
jgi:hypothetical protein